MRDYGVRPGINLEAFIGRHPLMFLGENPVGGLRGEFFIGIVRVLCGGLEVFRVIFESCSVGCMGV